LNDFDGDVDPFSFPTCSNIAKLNASVCRTHSIDYPLTCVRTQEKPFDKKLLESPDHSTTERRDERKVAGFIPPRVIAISFCEEALRNQSGQSRKSCFGKDTSTRSRMAARLHTFRLSGLRQMRDPPTPITTARFIDFQSDRLLISEREIENQSTRKSLKNNRYNAWRNKSRDFTCAAVGYLTGPWAFRVSVHRWGPCLFNRLGLKQ
jgi:hypothetical protein